MVAVGRFPAAGGGVSVTAITSSSVAVLTDVVGTALSGCAGKWLFGRDVSATKLARVGTTALRLWLGTGVETGVSVMIGTAVCGAVPVAGS